METRSQQVRRHQRRVLVGSMAVAAALHVGLFAFSPQFTRSLSEWTSSPLTEGGEMLPGSISIDITFGPPLVRLPDGEMRREPPDRTLAAREVAAREIPPHHGCDWLRADGFASVTGTVELVVSESGRVIEAAIAESFGDPCTDQALVAVSGRLWYHWLPNEDVSAPVYVIQPMAVEPVM